MVSIVLYPAVSEAWHVRKKLTVRTSKNILDSPFMWKNDPPDKDLFYFVCLFLWA